MIILLFIIKGKLMKKLSLFCVMGLYFANFAFSEELEFDSLEISGSKIKNDEKPFVTPGATSTRDNLNSSTQSIDSIVRSVPGAYTQVDQAQGGGFSKYSRYDRTWKSKYTN